MINSMVFLQIPCFNDVQVSWNVDCNIHDSLLYGRLFTVNSVASDLNLNATHRP